MSASSLSGPGARAVDRPWASIRVDLLLDAAGYFNLSAVAAREVIRDVASAVRQWYDVAAGVGARRAEIEPMASAFEHEDLHRALRF